jgi:hypothetical protein
MNLLVSVKDKKTNICRFERFNSLKINLYSLRNVLQDNNLMLNFRSIEVVFFVIIKSVITVERWSLWDREKVIKFSEW